MAVDSYQEPTMMSIFLKQSKDRVGMKLFVGHTYRNICPVAAVLAYMGDQATQQLCLSKREEPPYRGVRW